MQSRMKRFKLAIPIVFLFFAEILFTGCQGLNGSSSPTPTPTPVQTSSMNSINHIVLFMQENRSFDHYFGQLNVFRAANGLPQDVDTWTTAPDKSPANVSTVGFAPGGAFGPPIHAFHMQSQCSENLSPSWNETHVMYNLHNPSNGTVFPMDGFAWVQGKFASNHTAPPENFQDVTGKRSMGFYDQTDLPFYYFMASNFATSDRWFSPAPTRTHPNRFYWIAATSQGLVTPPPPGQITQKTIFELMDENHVSWKIYSTDGNSYYFFFSYSNTHRTNVVPLAQYFTDLQNGTLPQVAYIETGIEQGEGGSVGVDEHPKSRVQSGAAFAANLINKLMQSPSWKDTVFIETFDEGGGFYDHVPPIPVVSPDGIPPILGPTDIKGDFTLSGFRVPLIVISPFTKKNFVSHLPMDSTAALKMIETRFHMPPLTQRDATQPDMWGEFFDFSTASGPWATPPTPPPQPDTLPCTFGVPAG
jgi:phospholipase C